MYITSRKKGHNKCPLRNALVVCAAQLVLKVLSLLDWCPLAPFSLLFPFCLILFLFSIYWLDTSLFSFCYIHFTPFFLRTSLLPSTSLISSFLLPNSELQGPGCWSAPNDRSLSLLTAVRADWNCESGPASVSWWEQDVLSCPAQQPPLGNNSQWEHRNQPHAWATTQQYCLRRKALKDTSCWKSSLMNQYVTK